MSVIVRLQNLPWSAVAADIRHFFAGLSIPEGGVNIVGGELGDAFIAFSTDEDARLAMQRDGGKVKDCKVKLLLSSRTEMQRETTRQQSLQLQFLQMQQMQTQAAPQSSAAAAVPQSAAAMPGFPMQQQQQQQQHTGAPNMQPSMPNVQQNIYGQSDPAAQPPSITPMQYPQMPPFPMTTPSANSAVTSMPQPPELPAPHMSFQVRDQPNMQQLPPGQMPSFQTASPQINQPYQMPIPQVNQSPVSQAMTSHVPIMPTTGHHMAQQQNFQPQQQPQMNVAPNFQSPMQQMHPPGFQTQLVNQPPHFQSTGAPRMGQPQQFPQTNQNAPFQPSFPPNPPNAPPFQMANQQGSPAPSFPSASPQVPLTQGSQNFPNSRLPLLQRKPENKVNNDNNSDGTKNERARRSRSGSSGSRSQSRDNRNRDKDPDKDKRRRNSREFKQPRDRRDRSRSKDRRTSRDRRRDDDSRWGRKNDNKRSTDPKQLYKDYQNPNSSFKPSVMPANQSKTDANSNSTRAHTASSTNLDTKTASSKTTEKSENKESDTKSTSNPNYSGQSSQQNDKMNKIESSPNNKDNEVTTTNPSSNSTFKASNSNKSSHGGGEYRRGTSPAKRKAPNDEYNPDTHYRSKGDHYEGGGRRRRRGFDETPARFDNEHHNRMNYDEPAYEHKPGFGNAKFDRFDSRFNEPNSFDYPQPPGIGWQNNPVPNVDCCVVLQNFPIFNGAKDVYDFFYDLSPNMYIKLQRNDYGNLDGALIRFANYGDKQKGLKRNGFKLKKSVVAVHHISDRAFDEADDALFPQKDTNKTRLEEKIPFRIEHDLKTFQCLCLEGNEGVDPVFDCKNVYHEEIRVVFNQINPLELFIYYGTIVNRAFVRFENFAKANSAKNLFAGLTVDFIPIKVFPCSDEQFEKFKEIVEKEESNKEPDDDDKKGNFQPNKRGRMSRSMFPNPSSFGNRYNHMNDADLRIGNRKDPRAPKNFRIEGLEMEDFENPVPNFNSRTLLPNPPMAPLQSSPKKSVSRSRCIIMQGLPLTVHYQDIVNFFSSVNIQPKQIHVMVENGSPTGDAFCEFSTMEEADMAVKRNNCQLGVNFVHVCLVSQEELDRAVGKGRQKPPLPPHLLNQPGGLAPPPHLPGPPGGAAPPPQFGQPPFDGAPPSDSGFRGGMRGAFRGRGQFPMIPRGRGRGGFESGGRGAFEGAIRGGRGRFENGGRGGFEGGVRRGRGGFEGGFRGGFEGGVRGGFEGGVRGGFEGDVREGFEGGVRGGFEGGVRGGRGGFEGGVRGGRGGFEGGGRGGFRAYEGGGRGGFRGARGGFLRGRGGRSFGSPSSDPAPPAATDDDKERQDEDDLLPESKVASFGQPGCVVAAENIPYRADVTDILDFFKSYNLVAENVIRRYNDYGQVTGDARIAFRTPADAEEAIRLHDGASMQNRTIHLHLVR